MPRIKRPHSIVVKVTAEERDAFYRASSKLKLSGSDWLRGLGMVEVMDKPVELEGPSDMGNPITELVPPIQPFVEATPLAMKQNPVSQPETVTSKGGVSGIISGIKDWISPKPQAKPAVESPAQPEFKNGDLVAKVPPEWGTIQPAADAPKPPTAEVRMYQVITVKQGKAAADNWLKSRQKPAPVVIGEPQVPGHLRAFYDNLVKNQGQAQADFWLLTNTKGVKLSP